MFASCGLVGAGLGVRSGAGSIKKSITFYYILFSGKVNRQKAEKPLFPMGFRKKIPRSQKDCAAHIFAVIRRKPYSTQTVLLASDRQ